MAIKTEAIVLGSRPLKEADRWYYVLTPLDGKLRLILKSAGRSSSKLAGHLWPGNRVRLLIGRGRNDHLAGVTILNSFGPSDSLPLSLLQSFVLELVTAINVSGQEAAREYQLLWSILTLIHDESLPLADRIAAVRGFAWSLLSVAGWQPSFRRCAVCATVIDNQAVYYSGGSGFVCSSHQDDSVLEVSPGLQQALKQLSLSDGSNWLTIVSDLRASDADESWWRLTQKYVRDIIDQPLRTLDIYNYLLNDVYYQASTIPSR
ncbi:MAG: DNA repair protein RecO [Candidatus Komeilibacteria bacterium]